MGYTINNLEKESLRAGSKGIPCFGEKKKKKECTESPFTEETGNADL